MSRQVIGTAYWMLPLTDDWSCQALDEARFGLRLKQCDDVAILLTTSFQDIDPAEVCAEVADRTASMLGGGTVAFSPSPTRLGNFDGAALQFTVPRFRMRIWALRHDCLLTVTLHCPSDRVGLEEPARQLLAGLRHSPERRFTDPLKVAARPSAPDVPLAQAAIGLRVRLYPDDTPGLDGWAKRFDLDGTCSVLVHDRGSAEVGLDQAARWERTEDDLLTFALRQVLENERCEPGEVDLGGGLMCPAISGNPYAATHALLLDRWPRLLGRHGALVALPASDLLLSYPIEGPSAWPAVSRLIAAAQARPTLTPFVFWYHDGIYERVHYAPLDRLILGPPDGLLNVLGPC